MLLSNNLDSGVFDNMWKRMFQGAWGGGGIKETTPFYLAEVSNNNLVSASLVFNAM